MTRVIETRVTALERAALRALPQCRDVSDLMCVSQADLDASTPEIIGSLQPHQLVAHIREVYEETAAIYATSPQHEHIQSALVRFMNSLWEGDFVLDLGCGPGRDAWYMAVSDEGYRRSLMTEETLQHWNVPKIALRVVGIDASAAMRAFASAPCDFASVPYPPLFERKDMYADLADLLRHAQLHGIWSNASFLTHTPWPYVPEVFRHLAGALRDNGVLALSYTQRTGPFERYDYLKVSSSGRIKYFSHPRAEEVSEEAQKHGLVCEYYAAHDYVDQVRGQTVPNLFVTQFFRKVR